MTEQLADVGKSVLAKGLSSLSPSNFTATKDAVLSGKEESDGLLLLCLFLTIC